DDEPGHAGIHPGGRTVRRQPVGQVGAVAMSPVVWRSAERIETQRWRCGFCDHKVASDQGWSGQTFDDDVRHRGGLPMWVAICPSCSLPSVIDRYGRSEPTPKYGEPVEHLPDDVQALYDEARRAVGPSLNS